MAHTGICSLCLEFAELTFEHIPPRRVFNDRPTVAHTLYGLHLGSQFGKPPPLLRGPAGLGRCTLCRRCNGLTASYYGEAFADWTTQCLRYADRGVGSGKIILSFRIQPLNVLKQITTMIMAVSMSTESAETFDAIRAFTLSRESMALPNDVIVAAYLNPTDPGRAGVPLLTQNRLAGPCAILDTRVGTSVFVVGEVAFPPMGYVIYRIDGAARVSADFAALHDLRAFSNLRYGRFADLFMNMPVRYPFGPVPGHYPNLGAPGRREMVDDNHVVVTSNTNPTPARR